LINIKFSSGHIQGSASETILESARRQSVKFEHSCSLDVCGVCSATLIEGEIVVMV